MPYDSDVNYNQASRTATRCRMPVLSATFCQFLHRPVLHSKSSVLDDRRRRPSRGQMSQHHSRLLWGIKAPEIKIGQRLEITFERLEKRAGEVIPLVDFVSMLALKEQHTGGADTKLLKTTWYQHINVRQARLSFSTKASGTVVSAT